MDRTFSRRQILIGATAAAGFSSLPPCPGNSQSAAGQAAINKDVAAQVEEKSERATDEPFRYCLNMATIRGQKLPLPEQVEVAATAGYSGIEPWVGEIDSFARGGGNLKDIAKRISDLGLTVESAIGFARWIVDDPEKRAQGLEQAKRDMDLVRQIGGSRIAAPPTGATNRNDMDLLQVARRYHDLLEVGHNQGVVPQLEVWGFSGTLSRLGESTLVAMESDHRDACLLPDIYHLYRGGSDFIGLGLLGPGAMHVFHVNDYPADPPREKISDADRVFPGDGVAETDQIFQTLDRIGFTGALSLEVFNRDYWQQDPYKVAREGLEKTRAVVRKAFS